MFKILICDDRGFIDSRYFSDEGHFLNSVAMYRRLGYEVKCYVP